MQDILWILFYAWRILSLVMIQIPSPLWSVFDQNMQQPIFNIESGGKGGKVTLLFSA